MLRVFIMAAFLVGVLAACDTATDALAPFEEAELSMLSHGYGDGTIVTGDNVGVDWVENVVGDDSALVFTDAYPDLTGTTTDYGHGALLFMTEDATSARAEVFKEANVALADVTSLAYWTYQTDHTGNTAVAAVAYKMVVLLEGTTGWTTLVYEPYWQSIKGTGAPVVNSVWQHWENIENGSWWSNQLPGGQDSHYTLSEISALYPNAVVIAAGLGIGSWNANWQVLADGMVFGGTMYNFEPYIHVPSADDCKDGGWQDFTDPTFRNQGQCIAYFQANENSVH